MRQEKRNWALVQMDKRARLVSCPLGGHGGIVRLPRLGRDGACWAILDPSKHTSGRRCSSWLVANSWPRTARQHEMQMSRHSCSNAIGACALRTPTPLIQCTTRRATPNCGLGIAPKPSSLFLPVNLRPVRSAAGPVDAPHPKNSPWGSRDPEMQLHWTTHGNA